MKNLVKLMGIIALVAVIGFSMTACSIEIDAPNTSLNGVWFIGNYNGSYSVVTISGSSGILSSFNFTDALWSDAVNKGYIKAGNSQFWRNLKSTGNLTWSWQELTVTSYTSRPNVAVGTGWANCTITMSADGQTITNDNRVTWTRQ